jgi:hypothetical protein
MNEVQTEAHIVASGGRAAGEACSLAPISVQICAPPPIRAGRRDGLDGRRVAIGPSISRRGDGAIHNRCVCAALGVVARR